MSETRSDRASGRDASLVFTAFGAALAAAWMIGWATGAEFDVPWWHGYVTGALVAVAMMLMGWLSTPATTQRTKHE